MRRLSVVEAALGISLLGSLAAIGVPAFVRNLHASRLSEATAGLSHIGRMASLLAEASGLPEAGGQDSPYPESVGLTPSEVPAGVLVTDPPGTWDHETWRTLEFSMEVPHAYSFEFQRVEPELGQAGPHRFRAHARGDLDGDGQLSRFTLTGEYQGDGKSMTLPLEMHREVE